MSIVVRFVFKQYLLILKKPNIKRFIQIYMLFAAANSRHQDHFPLLALKLLHGTNLHNPPNTQRKTAIILFSHPILR